MKKLIFIFIISFFAQYSFVINKCCAQWVFLNSGTTLPLERVEFLNDTLGFVVGWQGKLLKTTDAGNNWNTILTEAGSTYNFSAIQFINPNTGFIGGGNNIFSPPVLIKTTNGGANWTIQTFTAGNGVVDAISFPNQNTGYIVGVFNNGTASRIFKTTNQGSNWFGTGPPSPFDLHGVFFNSADTGYAVGTLGRVMKTVDGGLSWVISTLYSNYDLYSVYFIDLNTGFTSGDGGLVSKTTNQGYSWVTTSTTYDAGESISFPSPETGYLVGYGAILKTTDTGNSWLFQSSCDLFLGSYFTGNNTGYAVGHQGWIIKTTTGGGWVTGQVNSENFLPKQFLLFQNYPNPFNPSTKIQFEILKSSQVQIKVFDITGKLVSELVNEKLNPGKYETAFDGSNFPSGVYFYKIRAGEFVQSKKMVLVK